MILYPSFTKRVSGRKAGSAKKMCTRREMMGEQELDWLETLEITWVAAQIEDRSRIGHGYCFKNCEKNQN
jgi:hypothetical protein